MAYTPELSYQHSCILRRIAWALEMPMTRTIGAVLEYVVKIVDSKKICEACRDKTRCEDCVFSQNL